MKQKYLDSGIESLDVDSHTQDKLKINNINYIKDLWVLKRKDLKMISLTDKEINNIIVKLQLNGLDLNKKKY